MDTESPLQCPNTVTIRRNPPRRARPTPSTNLNPKNLSSNLREISSFPVEDILSIEIPQNDAPCPSSSPPPQQAQNSTHVISENLKVYLRIRPAVTLKPGSKHPNSSKRNKNVWPQNPLSKDNTARVKKVNRKSCEVCINVNDVQSVTLSPPATLQDSKRIKSEVFGGFSHVFASDTTQNEVYEKMVKPLVEDFLNGKNGLLAALGPSGSGKTHTVFGTPREPGMVPLALQQIFKETQQCVSNLKREFKLSIFEIYSDRGKAERISDLSTDGANLSLQQSTIKGLQEVVISNAEQAASLIARAMLKRTTALTNTNSQSSRSQCIINIHSFIEGLDDEPNNAVLTIVDLAGAERERRTGNQGSRLLESNFINNTSMVFGLCLRSLLEHQNNPKKPLQKHFKNSLLTRYLRDYLEGKKRMSLILTVKPGEDDYFDTSNLLRQASPFMKIKFTGVQEPMVHNKRQIEMYPRVVKAKKMRYNDNDANVTVEGNGIGHEHPLLLEEAKRIHILDTISTAPVKTDSVDLLRERNYQITQNFAKALWNVLKQYKEKLTMAEKEIQNLKEVIGNEKTRYLELEKEFEDFKSCCTCSKENSMESTLVNIDAEFEAPTRNMEEDSGCNNSIKKSDSGQGKDQDVLTKALECSRTPQKINSTQGEDQNVFPQIEENVHSLDLKASGWDCCPRKVQDTTPKKCDSFTGQDLNVFSQTEKNAHCLNPKESKCDYPRKDQDATPKKCDSTLRQDQDVFSQTEANVHSLNCESSECINSSRKDQNTFTKELGDPSGSPKAAGAIQQCNLDVLHSTSKSHSCKTLNVRPKRRLLPASSILLRDITPGIEDEPEKPKGHRGVKKLTADGTKRTQGSISLLCLLQSNRHV